MAGPRRPRRGAAPHPPDPALSFLNPRARDPACYQLRQSCYGLALGRLSGKPGAQGDERDIQSGVAHASRAAWSPAARVFGSCAGCEFPRQRVGRARGLVLRELSFEQASAGSLFLARQLGDRRKAPHAIRMLVLLHKRVAILVADGFEQVELIEPRLALERTGARTTVVSPSKGTVRAWR